MPTYQYACTDATCGHRFDAVQSFTDDPLQTCPVCSGRLRKVFSAVGVVFKGSGFYRTDSRAAENGRKTAGAEKKSEAASGSSAKADSSSGSSSSSSSSDSGSSGSGSSTSSPAGSSSSSTKAAAS